MNYKSQLVWTVIILLVVGVIICGQLYVKATQSECEIVKRGVHLGEMPTQFYYDACGEEL